MKIFPIFFLFSFLVLSGCQSQKSSDNKNLETNNEVSDSSSMTSSYSNDSLPNYGAMQPDGSDKKFETDTVASYEAHNEGRLTIKNGCVFLTYPKDRYPESTAPDGFSSMLIFPEGSKFIEDRKAIKVNNKIYRDGDYIEMSGRETVRDFGKSLQSNRSYTPIPSHCYADEYWEVGEMGLRIAD